MNDFLQQNYDDIIPFSFEEKEKKKVEDKKTEEKEDVKEKVETEAEEKDIKKETEEKKTDAKEEGKESEDGKSKEDVKEEIPEKKELKIYPEELKNMKRNFISVNELLSIEQFVIIDSTEPIFEFLNLREGLTLLISKVIF